MSTVLITGGAGFFGEVLTRQLLEKGHECISVDVIHSNFKSKNLFSYQGDIRDDSFLNSVFSKYKFSAVFHCAAVLAHGHNDKDYLWSSNVDGTKVLAENAKRFGVPNIVFTSSNCLWGKGFDGLVKEDASPFPVEIYGKSKLEGEKILLGYKDYFNVSIIRCPTIIDCGRLGLLTILFEFIMEGRKVWVVGDGSNRYQFIYAKDLADACIKSLFHDKSDIFHIGSDNVKSFREVYQYVIDKAGTGAKVACLPEKLTRFGMKAAFKLGLSPLGPYQFKMISESFVFDTSKIKKVLGWAPTLSNEEMLFNAYTYFSDNLKEIKARKGVSAHRSSANMGIIKVLKWIS